MHRLEEVQQLSLVCVQLYDCVSRSEQSRL